MNRRTFLKVGTAATCFLLLPSVAPSEEHDGAAGGSLSSGANERIEKHRKGGGRIKVRDSMGQPLNGVKIKVEQRTKAQGVTDAEGNYPLRAFFGTHRLSLELPNGRQATHEVHWQRVGQNEINLVM